MLPKKNRVKKSLFKKVFSAGRVFHSNFLSLRVSSGEGAGRFSFVAPKSVAKSAVKRNLLRRRGYGAVKNAAGLSSEGKNCVFFFKKGSGEITYRELDEEIKFLLEKSGLIKK